MTMASPVSHTHYFCLTAWAVAGAAFRAWDPAAVLPPWRTLALLAAVGVLFALPMIPFWDRRREVGLSLLGALVVWTAAVRAVGRVRPAAVATAEPQRLAA